MQNLIPLPRFTASLFKLLALLFCAFTFSAASAQAPLVSVPSAGLALTRLEVLPNVPTGLTLAQVQSGQAGVFETQDGVLISHAHWHRAVWLRLHLKVKQPLSQALPPLQPAVLMLPTTYLDKVRLYTPGQSSGEPWLVQQAGDFYAPRTWAMRGLYPKFKLPDPAQLALQGEQELQLYMQIEHMAPVVLQLEIADAKAVLDQDLLQLLLLSLGLGAILLATVLTAAMAWFHRDAIYAWYSVYALSAALACASHSGIAIHVLWPVAGYWPSTGELSFVMLAAVSQMQFAWVLNTEAATRRSLRMGVHIGSAACLLIALCFPIFTSYWQMFYFASLLSLGCAMALIAGLMVLAWRAGHLLAGIWMLASIPLFGSLFLDLAVAAGLLPSNLWSRNAPIYAAFVQVLILGLALQWLARKRHGELERERALAITDPLTGFVQADVFKSRLARSWERRQRMSKDMAVAYVQIQAMGNDALQSERMLMRCVRVLRSATRTQDIVARLGSNLMAISMPDVSMGDDLAQRLSRMVALGLMPDHSDPRATVLQFRIAASTCKRFRGDTQDLDRQLRELLAYERAWGNKPIRYLDDRRSSVITQRPGLDSGQLEDMWDAALAEEINSSLLSSNAAEPASPTAKQKITIARFQRK